MFRFAPIRLLLFALAAASLTGQLQQDAKTGSPSDAARRDEATGSNNTMGSGVTTGSMGATGSNVTDGFASECFPTGAGNSNKNCMRDYGFTGKNMVSYKCVQAPVSADQSRTPFACCPDYADYMVTIEYKNNCVSKSSASAYAGSMIMLTTFGATLVVSAFLYS